MSAFHVQVRRLATAAALAAAGAGAAHAQVVDKGSFHLTVDGTAQGTEEFEIRRSGTGAAIEVRAQGSVTYRTGKTVETMLIATGPDMAIHRYSVALTGDENKRVIIARMGNRLEARTSAEWGEELREYRATEGTVLLEDDVAHLYFLLAALAGDTRESVHAVSPLTETQGTLPVISRTNEVVDLGGERIATTKVRIGAGDDAREMWYDASGRLMRLSIPSRGTVAERIPGN